RPGRHGRRGSHSPGIADAADAAGARQLSWQPGRLLYDPIVSGAALTAMPSLGEREVRPELTHELAIVVRVFPWLEPVEVLLPLLAGPQILDPSYARSVDGRVDGRGFATARIERRRQKPRDQIR